MKPKGRSLPCTALILLRNCINNGPTFFFCIFLTKYKENKLWEALSYFHKLDTHHLWCYKHIDLALKLPAVKLASRIKLTFTQVLYYMLEHKNSQSILQSTCYLDKSMKQLQILYVQISTWCLLLLSHTFTVRGNICKDQSQETSFTSLICTLRLDCTFLDLKSWLGLFWFWFTLCVNLILFLTHKGLSITKHKAALKGREKKINQ